MGEIGSGSGSSYPGSLDTDSSVEYNAPAANKTKARASVVNDLAAAIIAIETELGIDPAGSKATVVARMAVSLEVDGSPKETVIVTVSGSNQQISGHKVFASGIATGIWGIQGTATASGINRVNVTQSGALIPADGIDAGGHGTYIKTKVIDIGDWNMDSTASVNIAHGLTQANIRGILVIIRSDLALSLTGFPVYSVNGTTNEGIEAWETVVTLTRSTGGYFDSTAFDATSFNRGWIIIDYV